MHFLSYLRSFRFSRTTRSTRRRRFASRPARPQRVRLRLEALEDRVVMSANMVADLNTDTQASYPNSITSAAGTTFFTATTNSGYTELFKTDGTAAGTVQLTSGIQLYDFSNLTSFNGKLFFQAYDSARGMDDLWTSDGTVAGTTPFLASGSNVQLSYFGEPMSVVGTKLYFLAYDSSNGLSDLWVSNGASTGTHPVQPGSTTDPTNLSNFTNVNGKLFFLNKNSSGNYELWTSNGTASGTTLVQTFGTYQPTNLTAVGSTLYFEMYDTSHGLYALWKSDGTSSGTTMIGDVGPTNLPFASLTALGNNLFFQVYDTTDAPDTYWALWSYNGTTIAPFTYGGSANYHVEVEGQTQMIVFNSELYFEAYDTTNGMTLWSSDGVSGNSNTGVVLSSTSVPIASPQRMTIDGSTMYFLAQNPADKNNYNDLWSTNGTSSGTAPVQTSNFAQGIAGMTASGSKIFFQAFDVDATGGSPHGLELWVSDGTNAGTGMVTDINTNTDDSSPSNPNNVDHNAWSLITDGNEVFFDAFGSSPVSGTYLWQSDGTAANTAPVQTSTGVLPTAEQNVTLVGNTVFFTANGSKGNDLWTTGAGLKSAVEIFAGSSSKPFGYFASSDGTSFASLNGKLYFGAFDLAHSEWALWQSDGTAAGTTVVADLDPSHDLTQLTAVGNNLYWQQYDSAHSTYALWEYNSSTGTASLVQDFSSIGITHLTAVGSNLYFQAYDSTNSKYALWMNNGTTTTLQMEFNNPLDNWTAFNNLLWFDTFNSSLGGNQMWTSGGPFDNTTAFLNGNGLPVLVDPGLNGSLSAPFTIVGSKLYYANSKDQLAVTDGTADGTGDVQAGAGLGVTIAQNVNYLTNDNGMLVFEAYDPAHGTELWQSDGTADGTLLADDIVSGPGSSNPTNLAVIGNQVLFSATDYVHGYELWTATLGQNVVTAGLSGPTDGVTEQHRPFILTANDSSSGNNAAGFSFAINWGDGTSETITGQSGFSADHQYANVGNFTISVTATNLADGITSAAYNQVENITQTEIQNGDLALGGVAGDNAWAITRGSSTGYFTVTINGSSTPVIKNYKPAAGMHVLLYSGNGTNSISFNDAAVTSRDTFTIGSGFVIYNNATFIAQNPVSGWTINGSNAADTYTISGTLNATINAGSKNDTFRVSKGANLLGTLDGGGGVNTLDYSAYTTSGVIVDLPLGSATAINGGAAGGIANIQNINGSGHGNDILVGDGNVNVIKSHRGHNILIGGSGGGDTLTSAGSGDILIAGSTTYDSNIAALQFIESEWVVVKASTYASIINNIQNSATDPLNGSTVTDSGSPDAADTLVGKSGKTAVADWYFAHTSGGSNPNDTVTNEFSGETVTGI